METSSKFFDCDLLIANFRVQKNIMREVFSNWMKILGM